MDLIDLQLMGLETNSWVGAPPCNVNHYRYIPFISHEITIKPHTVTIKSMGYIQLFQCSIDISVDIPSSNSTQLLNITIEILSFPIYSMVIFHGYVSHYQRVNPLIVPLNHYKVSLNHYKVPLNHYKVPFNHYTVPLNNYKIQCNHHSIPLNHNKLPLNHYKIP